MAVAVIAKFLNPTHSKGARIQVKLADHRKGDIALTFDYHGLEGDTEDKYGEAFKCWAREFLRQKPGSFVRGAWAMGSTQDGYVFVRVSSTTPDGSEICIL